MSKLKEDGDELFHESMQNAYVLITKKLNFDDLFDYNGCMLPFPPKKHIDNKVFEKTDIKSFFEFMLEDK